MSKICCELYPSLVRRHSLCYAFKQKDFIVSVRYYSASLSHSCLYFFLYKIIIHGLQDYSQRISFCNDDTKISKYISSDPPSKDGNARFTMVPLNPNLIKI